MWLRTISPHDGYQFKHSNKEQWKATHEGITYGEEVQPWLENEEAVSDNISDESSSFFGKVSYGTSLRKDE